MKIMFTLLVSFFLSWMTIFGLLKVLGSRLAMDQPNERSLHTVPVPRTGGIGVLAGLLAGWLLNWQPWMLLLLAGIVMLAAISFLDDLKGIAVRWRFLAHFVAAGGFLYAGFLSLPIWLVLVVLFVMVWMTNLYNFMDGSDGLAGGMALFGFSAYAVAGWLKGDLGFAIANGAIAASALGFLTFNFHPARIFMGDVGSIPLGFLAAAMGLVGMEKGLWPAWFPVLVFSPFIVDATFTLFRRLLQGEKVWQAHRSHFYQRLVQMGWGHRKTALGEYGMMAVTGGTALWLIEKSSEMQLTWLMVWFMIYVVLGVTISRAWSRRADQ